MARREGFAVRCALYRIRERGPELGIVRVAGFIISNGTPGGIRTPDPQVRSLMLYPAELPARNLLLGSGGPSQYGRGYTAPGTQVAN